MVMQITILLTKLRHLCCKVVHVLACQTLDKIITVFLYLLFPALVQMFYIYFTSKAKRAVREMLMAESIETWLNSEYTF